MELVFKRHITREADEYLINSISRGCLEDGGGNESTLRGM
jgi:hypothetical protein